MLKWMVAFTVLLATSAFAAPETNSAPVGSLRHVIWNYDNPAYQAKIPAYKDLQDNVMKYFSKADQVQDFSQYSPAQRRYRALLLVSRTKGPALFKELRYNEPVFYLPGDEKEKDTYLLSRYRDVDESFGEVGVPPKNLAVIYTGPMEKTVKGPFMLSGEGTPANLEKPAMHKAVNTVDDGMGKDSKEAAQKRVRSIVKRLMVEIMRNTAKENTIDVAPAISRNVAMGIVTEYFGFYPPDLNTQIQWSRNTQNSFFHNPLGVGLLDNLAIQSGTEMQDYITKKLLPEMYVQLEHGRPVNDTIGKMLRGHAGMRGTDRIVTNVMGLLVGAGETTTLAVVRSLKNLLDRPDVFKGAVEAAKKANVKNPNPKDEELFDHYVFEALRFQPINPWVERRATQDYEVSPLREDQTVADAAITVKQNARVLVGMESAMMDSAYVKEPEQFKLDRPLESYFHMSFDYHRCLGDDVAAAMVPEIIKQMLVNLEGLSFVDETKKEPDSKGSPFPESWVLKFTSKSKLISKPNQRYSAALSYFQSPAYTEAVTGGPEVALVTSYISSTANPDRVLNSLPPYRFNVAGMLERDQALENLRGRMTAAESQLGSAEICRSKMFTEESIGRVVAEFCQLPYSFRACYFLQRVGGEKTPTHAWNYCAYGKQQLSPERAAQAAATIGKWSKTFEFLNYK